MSPRIKPIDARIDRLAARQHGVVARTQLLAAGFSSREVQVRVENGRLRPLYRGVYLTATPAPPWHAEMAAALACGAECTVAFCSAAPLWTVLPAAAGPTHVITPSGNRARDGLCLHRISLDPSERTRRHNIPVTTVERTLLDLASTEGARTIERAAAEALALRLTTRTRIHALLARHPGARGTAVLRHVLEQGPRRVDSDLEERFLALVREAGIPDPDTNVRLHGFKVDFVWRQERLIVETDSRWHEAKFERDRVRDATLLGDGYRTLRITYRRLAEHPVAAVADLLRALHAARR